MLQQLVNWFEENQRPLPWRTEYDPYNVWVSEVMLQQTQVETALPYYERFIRAFPTIECLAKANEERVLALWAGLGYYRRAKNLLAAARVIVDRYDGNIPPEYDALIDLPGIGPYMAGAILSIAFNKPFPVVDGNVRRVLSRLYGWTEDSSKALWNAAARLVHATTKRACLRKFQIISGILPSPISNPSSRILRLRDIQHTPAGAARVGQGSCDIRARRLDPRREPF